MPAHKTPGHILALTREVIEGCLREGYSPPYLQTRGRSAHTEAASRLAEMHSIPANTAWGWIAKANADERYKPDYTLFRAAQYSNPTAQAYTPKPTVIPEQELARVALIGDAHDAPGIPKDRFRWLGKWIAAEKFDYAIQIGDWATMDSLTKHAAPGTRTFAQLPSFKQDLDSLLESLQEMDTGLAGYKCKKVVTLGNHDGHRASRYEDQNPQMQGMVLNQIKMAFESFGWECIDFGEMFFLNGVAMVHHPVNTLGKAYGGKSANQRAGNDALCSIIHGHDHRLELVSTAKLGPLGNIQTASIGCALPFGMVEHYAAHGPSGWWWGSCSATLAQGQILDFCGTSMLTLEKLYG